MVFRFSFDSLTEMLLLRVSVFYNSVSYPVILTLKLSLVQFHSLKNWTAGRVVDGARLERVCRATYLEFESLAVRQTNPLFTVLLLKTITISIVSFFEYFQ